MNKILLLGSALALGACAPPRGPVAELPAPEPAYASASAAADAAVAAVPAPSVDTGLDTSGPTAENVAESAARLLADPAADSAAPADTIAVAVATDAASTASPAEGEAAEGGWDMGARTYETQTRVARYLELFTGSARDRIVTRLERGTRYDAMIRAKLRAAGLPEDLTYLALVESGYDPNAYSRAAAVGMWQFMAGTARGTGLRVDWWIDERRDPVKSTDAAIKFLRYLREQFGSLYLAAAAYNGGPGRVQRGLSRFAEDLEGTTGEDRFFALAEKDYLREETKNYVPQIIAVALMAKEPERYGVELRTRPPYVYDSVKVGPAVPIAAVASAAGTSTAELVELNPHILRGVTPLAGDYFVRVPVGRAAAFDSAFAAVEPADRAAFRRVVSKKGQTLAAIASREGITARQLGWYNPKARTLKSGKLAPGQTLLVPSAAVVAAARDVPDPSLEIYGSSKTTRLHVVKKGESLGGIARKYGTTVATLRKLNGFRKDKIIVGQAIVVKSTRAAKPSAKPSAKSAAKSTKSAKSTASRTVSKAPSKSSAKSKTAAKTSTKAKPKAKTPPKRVARK